MNAPRSGSIRETLAIALPVVVSQACETALVFIGRMFLSKLDPELMNAAMCGGLSAMMMTSFIAGLAGYSTALVAQHLGAGRKRDCPVVVTQALVFCLLAYPVVLLLCPLAHLLFEWMRLDPGQLGPQKTYFDILLFGSLLPLFKGCLSAFFSGIGRTAVVMISSCVSMLVSALADYTLIFGHFGLPALGIRGAACGSLIGSAAGLGILVWAYFRSANRQEFDILRSFRFDAPLARKLLRYGSPTGLEMLSAFMSFNAIVLLFDSRGVVTATAATIMMTWDMVSFVPLMGFEIAITSLVGRYLGARRPELAHHSVISGMQLGQVYSMVIVVLFLAFPRALADVFRPSGASDIYVQAAPTAVFMLRVASVYVFTNAAFVVFVGTLRGAGDTFWAMSAAVAAHWTMVLVQAVVLNGLHQSAETAWVAIVAVFFLFFSIVFLRYRGGKWKSLRLVGDLISTKS